MIKHTMRYRTQYFCMGVLITGLVSSTCVYSQKYQADEAEIRTIRQSQAILQTQTDLEVQKVKSFYLKKNPRLWDTLALEMAQATVDAARHYQIPLDIQVGVNAHESELSPFAVSPTGAKGMGQVDFRAWRKELGAGNPFEPKFNQRGVGYVLALNIRTYGLKRGLEVYNLGEGNYKRGRRNPTYVSRVFEQASEYRYSM